MIVTDEMRAKILAEYGALKTSGEKASFVRKLKKAGLPVPTTKAAKHAKQDETIAAILAMTKPAEPVKPVKAAEPTKKAA